MNDPNSTPTSHVRHLFAVRESDQYNRELLKGMVYQTLTLFRDRPGAAKALELGLDPFDDPEPFDATVLRGPKYRAVLFSLDSTLFLYWAGSAAHSEDLRANAFVETLSKLIRQYQPEELLASTFSRFVRSERYSPQLKAELIDAKTMVRCRGIEMNMADATSSLIWDLLSFVAAQDRDSIETRLALGVMHQAKTKNLPPFGTDILPFGYEVVDGAIVPSTDPETQRRVREMIAVLGQNIPQRSKTEKLGQLGISNAKQRRLNGKDATVASARSPSAAIRTLNGWLELYRDGVHTMRRKIPATDLKEFGGFPVEVTESVSDDGRRLRQCVAVVPFDFAVPADGWAPPSYFEAWEDEIAAARERKGTVGGDAHKFHKPLSGFGDWVSGSERYALVCLGDSRYAVRRRPVELTGGWEATKRDSQLVCKLSAGALHTAIAEATVRAVTEGHTVRFIGAVGVAGAGVRTPDEFPLVVVADPATRRRRLTAQVDELARQRKVASNLAIESTDPELAAEYASSAQQRFEQLTRVRAELDALDSGTPVPAPSEVGLDASHLVRAMANLRACTDQAPRAFGESLNKVIRNLRLSVTADDDRVAVSFDLVLPGHDHLLNFEGITTFVALTPGADQYGHPEAVADRNQRILRLLRDGAGIIGVIGDLDRTEGSCRRLAASVLRELCPTASTGLRSVVVMHPLPEFRIGLLQQLEGKPTTFERPDLITDCIQALERTETVHWDKVREFNLLRQRIVNFVASQGGQIDRDQARQQPELKLVRSSGHWNHRMFNAGRSWTRGLLELRDDRLHLRTCPNCGQGQLQVVALPELNAMICTSCHLDADTGASVPPSYAALADATLWYVAPTTSMGERLSTKQSMLGNLPDHPFTRKELVTLAGICYRQGSATLVGLLEDGEVVALGRDPRHTGAGMRPRLYVRKNVDATRWLIENGA